MKYDRKIKKNLVLSILFLLILVVGICSKLSPTSFSSFSNIEAVWSGEVATSFSGGNGTKENPYQISRGEELAYFKFMIEKDEENSYCDKYYVLTSDINLGNLFFDPIGNDSQTFNGVFDGQGYTISNAKMDFVTNIGNNLYSGLFTKTNDATIKNLNIENFNIQVDENSKLNVGLLIGESKNTNISNISIINSSIKTNSNNNKTDINIGGLLGKSEKDTVNNIYLNININTKDTYNIGSISALTNETTYKNILVLSNKDKLSTSNLTSKTIYTKENIPSNILDSLNKDLTGDYYWRKDSSDNYYLYKEELRLEPIKTIDISDSITLHDSGVTDGNVYVNDLEADYNYYMGLNYTYSSDGRLPNTTNKNLYSDKNLVNVQITYNGSSELLDQITTGTVSTTELESKYIYYKVYPVNDNGTDSKSDDFIEVELIDNPFTNRPEGFGFNGWFTNYRGVTTTFDKDIYVRYAHIPITYAGDKPEDIVIEFKARWTTANVVEINDNSQSELTNAINNFDDFGFQQLETYIEHIIETPIYGPVTEADMRDYFIYTTVARYTSYNGNTAYYDEDGNRLTGRCNTRAGCGVYRNATSATYNPNTDYYELTDNGMEELDTSKQVIIDIEETIEREELFSPNQNMATYFERVTITRNNSYAGYYNSEGEYQESGTCTSTSGCTYYKLIQYYDNNGNESNYSATKDYYYLVTRDTNIMVLTVNLNSGWTTNQDVPLTFTGSYGGVQNNVTWTTSGIYVRANDDLVIENMTITAAATGAETTPGNASGNNTSRYLFGGWNNVKIGRGITQSGSNLSFQVAIAGLNTATGSSSNITRYRFVIESGFFSSLSLTGGSRNVSTYIDGEGIYGNDYDRVKKDNTKLDVYFCASGSWGSNVYQSGATSIAMHQIIKSGEFGSRRPTTENQSDSYYSYGIYVGGRNSGGNYTARQITVEGGWIYNIIGGPISQSSNSSYNDTYMYIKGGEVDVIIGGAGRTTTYGNRIIQITGGTVNYSVFGGSNGVTSSTSGDQAGKLTGTPYIYVGGNAIIGDETAVNSNSTLYGSEAGSIFGIGNGKSGTDAIGTADNSYIIVDGNATVLRNVYGGGNFGAVGISTTESSSKTEINIKGGTINGSIFGGGNRNGSGSTSKSALVTINQTGGTIKGSIYGGANEVGIIYGSVDINAHGGTVLTDIYGGGYGGRNNTSNGTYIRDVINIEIGNTSDDIVPTIEGSVYGGSAFGSVNGTSNSTNVSSNGITITVNEGIIKSSLFGGAKGNSTYTPYVMGNILVTVNDGNIGDIFGGNDAAGTPNGNVEIHLKGGTIGRVFGGGNNASVKTNYIYLEGSTCTEIFGGSNASGTVNNTTIDVTSGEVTTVYGGNNTAGNTVTSKITIDGGTIKSAVYGGGNLAQTTTTNVTLNKSYIPNVYGGGANANINTSTTIRLNGSSVGNLFGGSNAGGNVPTSTITVDKGYAANIYGGNNENGLTTTTNITINNGRIDNIYGGGNNVGVTTSNINLNNGTIGKVYGGSNKLGTVTNTNITASPSTNSTYTNDELEMTVEASASYDVAPYTSSTKLVGTIKNNSSVAITKWKAYIITTPSEIANNWSQSLIEAVDSSFIIDETNQWWGTNTIAANGSYSFEFYTGNNYMQSEFKVLGYYVVGYDDAGNEYTMVQSDGLNVGDLYGGNNLGGTTSTPKITLNKGTYNNIYGGGNQAETINDITLNIKDINVTESIYGGGNQANVLSDTLVNISGNTVIAKNVFGGGNHGAVGTESANDSNSNVNIAGATIGGSVYGGCNTSVVYGTTNVNIGLSAIDNPSGMTIDDIDITGTIFGGGEANESGSDTYDFSFISVTQGIDILIDGTNYAENNLLFKMNGSIFGSGNASSSSGPSNIYIRKLGTRKDPNTTISIQRADNVTIDSSAIELTGTTDRTNEYSNIKYSLNRIKVLKIKNSATLLLRENANMLESFYSLVDQNGQEVKAKVTIDDETKTVTKNTDNRLYMLAGTNLNVTTNEQATSYGVVSGMTFLGMYKKYTSGGYVYGMYADDKTYGSTATAGDVITDGSYVLGLHSLNHDITVDGYYTNYIDDDYTVLTTAYVNPTPEDANYYMWVIGIASINYKFNLTASKYSSLGTYELSLKDFADGNTTFNVIGFNGDGLNYGVVIKDSTQVPKLAATQEEANSIIGLSMKAETTEWTINDSTKFFTDRTPQIEGTTKYVTDNQLVAPSFMFYLYHAKNISSNQELGTVVITLQALTPKNEIEFETSLVTITVNIDTKYYDDADAYDASITYNKKYEMPSATNVNITNKSQFTAYYSLFAEIDEQNTNFYGKNYEYYHTLVSSYVLPVGTMITMIDFGINETNPDYYYFEVTQDIYNKKLKEFEDNSEVTYRISDFIRMDSISTNNKYQEVENNKVYYHEDIGYIMEEFIFIFDFKYTDDSVGEQKDNSIYFELRTQEDRTKIYVLSIRQTLMMYSLYEATNVVLTENLEMDSKYLYVDKEKDTTFSTAIEYNQTDNRQSIIDTNYESSSMGINIIFYDATGTQVSSSQLSSTSIIIDKNVYHADANGVFRIKLADKVSNLTKGMKFLTGSSLPTGNYTMKVLLFASNDGLHNSSDKEETILELPITVIGNDNLIIAGIEDKSKLVIGETGLNMNGTNEEKITITYSSELQDPNIRVAIYKRSTESATTNKYEEVSIKSLFSDSISYPIGNYTKQSEYEYMITNKPTATMNLTYHLNEKLTSGTYRIVFRLYDGNQIVDEDYKYIIVRKNI